MKKGPQQKLYKKVRSAGRMMLAALVGATLAVAPAGAAFAESTPEVDLSLTVQGSSSDTELSTQSSSATWSGAKVITKSTTTKNKTYISKKASQNALLVNTSGTVKLINPTVKKTGGTSAGDNESFYGTNSAVMCKGGGTTTISGATITTKAAGANGVFSYGGNASMNATSGDGTKVVVSNSTITTTGDGSGGIMTTGQGITLAKNLTVNTSGASSAAIRSDRGGGKVTVKGGTYKTSGTGSPAIYATATIKAVNAVLTSTASQGVVNEGGNTVVLNNCTLNAGNKTLNSQDNFRNGVFLYQSMSGDASSGASKFTMSGGTLNNTYGHVFHVTNTSATIKLNGVAINNTDSENVFLSVCDDAWSGLSNAVTLNATNQAFVGKILVGSDSTAKINLSGSSVWKGSTSGKITSHKDSSTISTKIGTVNVKLGSGSTWVLTGNSTVKSISGAGAVNYGKYKLYVNGTAYTASNPYSGVGSTTDTGSVTLSCCTVTLPKTSYVYTGSAIKPKPTVKFGSTKLTKGTDYTVSYSSNKAIGTATVKVTGKGDYTGTKKVTFKITKIPNTMTVTRSVKTLSETSLATAKGTVSPITVKNAKGNVTYTKKSGSKYLTINSSTGVVTVKKSTPAGTYKAVIAVRAAGGNSYKAKTKKVTITVKVTS